MFDKGEVPSLHGDAGDGVTRIAGGRIEALREIGAASVLLAHMCDGEWLESGGAVEDRRRSASTQGPRDGEGKVLTTRQILERVVRDPTLARELILRLSTTVKEIKEKITAAPLLPAKSRSSEEAGRTTSDSMVAEEVTVSVTAQSAVLQARIGATPLQNIKLPFIVGRTPVDDEVRPLPCPDLLIEDELPFRLSRRHFLITRDGDRVVVSDLGSTLGTIVNGEAIGHRFMRQVAPLRRGENHILAGGQDSSFKFLVSLS